MSNDEMEVFGLETLEHYLRLCDQAVETFCAHPAEALPAFSAILVLNHLPDWLEKKLGAPDREALGIEGFSGLKDMRQHFEAVDAHIRLVRNLANGFKHLRIAHPTSLVEGYGQGAYGVGPYGVPYLDIDLSGDARFGADRMSAERLCRNILASWRTILGPIIARAHTQTEGG